MNLTDICQIMKHKFKVRQASLQDLPEALKILEESRQWQISQSRENTWSRSWVSHDVIREYINSGALFMAWKEANALATIGLHNEDKEHLWADYPAGNAGYIGRLGVKREASGSGVVNILYNELEKVAFKRGLRLLRADIYKSERVLGKWCMRKGFESYGYATTPLGNKVRRFQKEI